MDYTKLSRVTRNGGNLFFAKHFLLFHSVLIDLDDFMREKKHNMSRRNKYNYDEENRRVRKTSSRLARLKLKMKKYNVECEEDLPHFSFFHESLVGKKLEEWLPDYVFIKCRPEWNKNPKTECNLEIDFFCEKLSLAIEVDGEQHYCEEDYYNKKGKDEDYVKYGLRNRFDYQLYKDRIKEINCMRKGIHLIRYRFEKESIESFYEKVMSYTKTLLHA